MNNAEQQLAWLLEVRARDTVRRLALLGRLPHFHPAWVGAALAFGAGTFLCIASADLLPELQFHSHDRVTLSLALLAGIGVAVLIARLGHVHQEHEHQQNKETTAARSERRVHAAAMRPGLDQPPEGGVPGTGRADAAAKASAQASLAHSPHLSSESLRLWTC